MSENTSAENTGTPEPAATPPAVEKSDVSALPSWAQDEIKSLRNEAASHRIKAREAEQTAATAAEQLKALTDEKTQLSDELSVKGLELTKLTVALNNGIPGESVVDFADLLKGSTAEEIQSHAEKVKAHWSIPASPPATDRSQGRGSSSPATPENAFAQFVQGQLS